MRLESKDTDKKGDEKEMKPVHIYLIWSGYLAGAVACQVLFDDFPADFFAFPVNVAVLLLVVVGLWILRREKKELVLCSLLSSPHTTFILLALLFLACVIQGFTYHSLTGSWWFVALLFALLCHLWWVLLRRNPSSPHKWRFVLNHLGLWLALTAGLFGSADKKVWRMPVNMLESSREAVDAQGHIVYSDYGIQLDSVKVGYYPDGTPKDYEVLLTINEIRKAALRVNNPYRLSWMDDLYLVSLEAANRKPQCVVQIVRQPWKYFQWAGIWMLLAGSILLFVQSHPQGRKEEAK